MTHNTIQRIFWGMLGAASLGMVIASAHHHKIDVAIPWTLVAYWQLREAFRTES